jgi:TRAP-type C4-dicarboxylate transport system permease large subunit
VQGHPGRACAVIPPSILLILFGVAAEVSIGELFIAGFGPGLLIGRCVVLMVFVRCRFMWEWASTRYGRLSVWTATRDAAALLSMPVVILAFTVVHLHAHRGLGDRGVLRAVRAW